MTLRTYPPRESEFTCSTDSTSPLDTLLVIRAAHTFSTYCTEGSIRTHVSSVGEANLLIALQRRLHFVIIVVSINPESEP